MRVATKTTTLDPCFDLGLAFERVATSGARPADFFFAIFFVAAAIVHSSAKVRSRYCWRANPKRFQSRAAR
ncbi:hypothetical protein SBBP2_1270018 [Burkholderiales bacterium]|nr:hypothetical protein SBBP2_1270018 [Burkholderiales bacterium]